MNIAHTFGLSALIVSKYMCHVSSALLDTLTKNSDYFFRWPDEEERRAMQGVLWVSGLFDI